MWIECVHRHPIYFGLIIIHLVEQHKTCKNIVTRMLDFDFCNSNALQHDVEKFLY